MVLFTCLVSFLHTFHYWLTHSAWVPVMYDLSLSPSFFPLPLFSSLQFATFLNCQRSHSLMVSFSTSCHHSITSLFHPFLEIAPVVGQRGSGVFRCHQGQLENELVKYDRRFESFLFQEYMYMLMYCSLISSISQSNQVSFWCCY